MSQHQVSGCRFEGSLIRNYCLVLQIDSHHWQTAVLYIVVLSSGSAAVSAFASAVRGFPAASCGGSCNCPGAAASCFPASCLRRSSNYLHFMKKSVVACICVVSACCTGSQSSALPACFAAKLYKSSRTEMQFGCRRTSMYEYVWICTSMYWYMYCNVPACTAMYSDRLLSPMKS
jgi:hypothetical protein